MIGKICEAKPGCHSRYRNAVLGVLLPGLALAAIIVVQFIFSAKVHLVEWGLLILFGVYYLTSIEKVETGWRGGITVLEQIAMETSSGWFFVPRIIAEIDRMPETENPEQFPSDPENISKRDDDQGLLSGEFRPIRAMTAGSDPEDGDDPLNTRLALELTFVATWTLREGGFFDVYIKIPGRRWEDKVANIRKRLRDRGETELVEEITERTPFQINRDLSKLNVELRSELEKAVAEWGIDIPEAHMQAPDWPHDVNIALARIASSRANLLSTQNDAKAERVRLTEEGEGKAAALRAQGLAIKDNIIAESEGTKAAAANLGMTGAEYRNGALGAEAISKTTLVLGEPGLVQFAGLGRILSSGDSKGATP